MEEIGHPPPAPACATKNAVNDIAL